MSDDFPLYDGADDDVDVGDAAPLGFGEFDSGAGDMLGAESSDGGVPVTDVEPGFEPAPDAGGFGDFDVRACRALPRVALLSRCVCWWC